jgi:MOSC domain-containing protein YiiM
MSGLNGSGHIYRISTAPQKGEKKKNTTEVYLRAGEGIDGDAHSTSGRPVSLLPFESFTKVYHPDLQVAPGDFAENITTRGLNYDGVQIGTRLRLGDDALLEVIQIGKKCHNNCIIRKTVGDCIMPREGVFAKVLTGGTIREGDSIRVVS